MAAAARRMAHVLLLACAGPGLLLAQDAAAGQAEADSWIMLIVKNGGYQGWTTWAVSVAALTIVVKLLMALRREVLMPPDLLARVEGCLRDKDYDGALATVSGDRSYLAKCLYGALSRLNQGKDEVKAGLDEAWSLENTNLMQTCNYVQLAAQISPMLGLFGTVSGMMVAFGVLSHSAGAANPKDLANGIMLALVTTYIGLFVAIPCNVCYCVIRNRIVVLSQEVGNAASGIVERMYEEGGSGE